MPRTLRTIKQALLKEAQKPGTGMGGSGRVEILRCVEGLRPGDCEYWVKFVGLKIENAHNADLFVYVTKRRRVDRRGGGRRRLETQDFCVRVDRGNGGRLKGPGAQGTFMQPLYNVPTPRDITGVYIAKPMTSRPITADSQVHLFGRLQDKSDRDPAEWYPLLHEHRKSIEDMFFERQRSLLEGGGLKMGAEVSKRGLGGGAGIGHGGPSQTDKSLSWLKSNAEKAFARFDADGSGSVDYGEYICMLRFLNIFMLPCESRKVFTACDMDGNEELDADQFEVALYVIMILQEEQSRQAQEARDEFAAARPGTTDTGATSATSASSERDRGGGAVVGDTAEGALVMRLAVHEAFESFDLDADGLLDQLEFNEALRSLGVVTSGPRDPLTQEADLRRLMDKVLQHTEDGADNVSTDDPTRLVTFQQFLSAWVISANVRYECRSRGITVPPGVKAGDALKDHVASEARARAQLMRQARSSGWEMKRQARIAKERARRALEKQAEKESSLAKKDLALKEKADRIAEKSARQNRVVQEQKLQEFERRVKRADRARTKEELDERHEIMQNRIREREILAQRMGWDKIDYSDQGLLEVPDEVYWFRTPKEPDAKEEAKDLGAVLLIDLSHNRLAEIMGDEFWFRTDKLQLLNLEYNELSALPTGLTDCRDLLSIGAAQNLLSGPTVLGSRTPMNHLPKLIHLDLAGNQITAWPEDGLGHCEPALTTLEVLKLCNNKLSVLPGPTLGKLCGLRELDLSNNRIHNLGSDDGIALLTNLHTLNLSGNELESVPEDFGNIGRSLLRLDLSNNMLRWLPSTLNEFTELRKFSCAMNQIAALPEQIRGLKELVEIDCSQNNIAMVPEGFGQLLKLEVANMAQNAISTLPDTVGLLTRLQDLDLHDNRLKTLPREMGSWVLLRSLDAHINGISDVPASAGHCTRLKTLDLAQNKIQTLPHTVSTLVNLELLNMNGNDLRAVTPGIGKVTNLRALDLGGNTSLHSLPREVGELGRLRTLNLSSCGIAKLPNDLVRMTALQKLWLRHNRLEGLPIELVEQIPTLLEFDVTGNPLSRLPDRWSGKRRAHVSRTGYSSHDAAEFIARQSRVYPVAVKVWELLMAEARRKGVWPEKKGKKMENAPLSLYDVGEEGGEEEDPEALSDDDVGEQHITNKGEGKEESTAREGKEKEGSGAPCREDAVALTATKTMIPDTDSDVVYSLPVRLTDFMVRLKEELGCRWDEYARETSIRFYKHARLLYGRTPRYDQLDEDDFQDETLAKELARRRIEDKVIWAHRDEVRAQEARMAGYEALLDGLGLKILDRRLRRDHAERTRMNRINETERLNAAVRKETARQEERSAQIKKDRETKKQREFEQLMAMVRTKISNLPPAEREKMERSNKSKKTKTSKEAFVISGEVLLPDNSTSSSSELGDDLSESAYGDSHSHLNLEGDEDGSFFMDEYEFGDGTRLFGMGAENEGEEGKHGGGGTRGSTRQYNSSRGRDRRVPTADSDLLDAAEIAELLNL